VVANAAGDRRSNVLRQCFARQVDTQAKCGVLAPCTGVGEVGRIGVAGGYTQKLDYLGIGARAHFPVVDARSRGYLARIKEVSPTKTPVEVPQFWTQTGARCDLGCWLARQIDTGERGSSVKGTKCRLEPGPNRRLAVRQRHSAVDVIRCKSRTGIELDRTKGV